MAVAFWNYAFVLARNAGILNIAKKAVTKLKCTMHLNESKCWTKKIEIGKRERIPALVYCVEPTVIC